MSSTLSVAGDESTLTKSSFEDEELISSPIFSLQQKLNFLAKEVDTLSNIVEQKDKEIECLRKKLRDEVDFQEKIFDLEFKLQHSLHELTEAKNANKKLEEIVQSQNEEKEQHVKEILEYQAKNNHLVSENERLNTLIKTRLEMVQDQEELDMKLRDLEGEKKQLNLQVEECKETIKCQGEALEERLRMINDWQQIYLTQEEENQILKVELEKQERRVEEILRENEQLKEGNNVFEHVEKETVSLKREIIKHLAVIESQEKEIEELRIKVVNLEKREAEGNFYQAKAEITDKENKDLYLKIAEKDVEIEEWKEKYSELSAKWEAMKEYKNKLKKISIEKEEMEIKLKGKMLAIKSLQESEVRLLKELNESHVKLNILLQENKEIKSVNDGYRMMIKNLKEDIDLSQ